MAHGRGCQAKGLENAGSTGHLAPAGQEDVVVSEEVAPTQKTEDGHVTPFEIQGRIKTQDTDVSSHGKMLMTY